MHFSCVRFERALIYVNLNFRTNSKYGKIPKLTNIGAFVFWPISVFWNRKWPKTWIIIKWVNRNNSEIEENGEFSILHRLNTPFFQFLKWGASSRWWPSLYCPIRIPDHREDAPHFTLFLMPHFIEIYFFGHFRPILKLRLYKTVFTAQIMCLKWLLFSSFVLYFNRTLWNTLPTLLIQKIPSTFYTILNVIPSF